MQDKPQYYDGWNALNIWIQAKKRSTSENTHIQRPQLESTKQLVGTLTVVVPTAGVPLEIAMR